MTTSETLASANGGAPGNPAPTERGPGEPVPTRFRSLLARLRPGPRFWGWAVPSLIAAVGGFLRFWHLDQPHELVFDETYYVKEGASYLKAGYELATNGDATPGPDELFTSGITDVFLNSPGFVVHPPVGKWMIAFGEWVFGVDSSWGWRFSVAAAGTLSLLMIGRIGRRLFGSTLLGSTAALLLAVDGEHFVLSRTGLLDLFVMFWALAGFGFLLIDRDRTTARLAARLARDARAGGADDDPEVRSGTDLARTSDTPISGTDPGSGADPRAGTEPRTGADPAPPPDAPDPLTAPARTGTPRLGIRWWRTAGWISLALAAGVKWSGLFFLVTFAVLSALWDVGRRRRTGHPNWLAVGLLRDGALSWVYLAPLAVAVYIGTWSGWLFSQGGYFRDWGQQHPAHGFSLAVPPEATGWGGLLRIVDGPINAVLSWLTGFIPDSLRSLWHYHAEMYHFNVTLHTPHPYQSNPWSWSVLGRPTAFYYQTYHTGQHGCVVNECSRAITDLGNPVIWWGGTLAIGVLLLAWALRRDWRAGAILAGLVGGYLPWFHYQARTIYTFYAVAFVPWIVLALTYALGMLLGSPDASARRRTYGAATAGAVVVLAVLAFAFFYPVLSGEVIPRSAWDLRMWLPSWI